MKKRVIALIMAAAMIISLSACGSVDKQNAETENKKSEKTESDSGDKSAYTIAVVPKMTSIAWFQRMEVGVKEYNETSSNDVFYTGPSEGDGALQAQVIEDLIAQKVDAICVVPFSTESLEPVLKKARDAGIVVISHEAAGMENVDYDIEAFDNEEYGRHFMEKLGELTGRKGEYVVEVGALTSKSHNQWVDSSVALQKETFPDMKIAGDKIETKDDQSISYDKIKEALTANPQIKGVQGSAMADVAGAALAAQELGLGGKVEIVGTSLVSVSGKYVKDGTIDMISFWDPAIAGKAMVKLAEKVLKGEELQSGCDLGEEGYDDLVLDGKVFTGKAWIDVTKENVDDEEYNF